MENNQAGGEILTMKKPLMEATITTEVKFFDVPAIASKLVEAYSKGDSTQSLIDGIANLKDEHQAEILLKFISENEHRSYDALKAAVDC